MTLRDHRHADGEQPDRAVGAAVARPRPGCSRPRGASASSTCSRSSSGKVPENQEGGPYRAARLARLRRRIRPLVLRRTKELVAPELPPKQEQELRDRTGARAPGALRHGAAARAAEGARAARRPGPQPLHRLPLAHAAAHAEPRARARRPDARAACRRASSTRCSSSCDEIVAEGHRALVFSQFTSFLALVARAAGRRRHRATPTSTARTRRPRTR